MADFKFDPRMIGEFTKMIAPQQRQANSLSAADRELLEGARRQQQQMQMRPSSNDMLRQGMNVQRPSQYQSQYPSQYQPQRQTMSRQQRQQEMDQMDQIDQMEQQSSPTVRLNDAQLKKLKQELREEIRREDMDATHRRETATPQRSKGRSM